MKRLSPKATDMVAYKGLMTHLCMEINGQPAYRTISKWDVKKVGNFLQNSARYYWPTDMMKSVLKTLSISEPSLAYNKEKKVEDDEEWKREIHMKLFYTIHKSCLYINPIHENDAKLYKYLSTGTLDECVKAVIEIQQIARDYYKFNSYNIWELMDYHYFYLPAVNKYGPTLLEYDKNKDPIELVKMVKCLKEEFKLEKSKGKRILMTSDM